MHDFLAKGEVKMTISNISSGIVSAYQHGVSAVKHLYEVGKGTVHQLSANLFTWDERLPFPIESLPLDFIPMAKKPSLTLHFRNLINQCIQRVNIEKDLIGLSKKDADAYRLNLVSVKSEVYKRLLRLDGQIGGLDDDGARALFFATVHAVIDDQIQAINRVLDDKSLNIDDKLEVLGQFSEVLKDI